MGLRLFNMLMISEADCCKKERIVTVGIGIECGINEVYRLLFFFLWIGHNMSYIYNDEGQA